MFFIIIYILTNYLLILKVGLSSFSMLFIYLLLYDCNFAKKINKEYDYFYLHRAFEIIRPVDALISIWLMIVRKWHTLNLSIMKEKAGKVEMRKNTVDPSMLPKGTRTTFDYSDDE